MAILDAEEQGQEARVLDAAERVAGGVAGGVADGVVAEDDTRPAQQADVCVRRRCRDLRVGADLGS